MLRPAMGKNDELIALTLQLHDLQDISGWIDQSCGPIVIALPVEFMLRIGQHADAVAFDIKEKGLASQLRRRPSAKVAKLVFLQGIHCVADPPAGRSPTCDYWPAKPP